jgi:flagellin-like hook-associated protein FlgL
MGTATPSLTRIHLSKLKPAIPRADKLGMDITSIALQGVEQAQVQLDAATESLASAGASPNGANLDTADLASGVVALTSAQTLMQLSLSTLKTADQVSQTALNLLA